MAEPGISRMTVRLPKEVKELLEYESIRQDTSQNNLIVEAIRTHLELNRKDLELIKKVVVSARVRGSRSLAESLQQADKAATLDDSEGLGPIKVSKPDPGH